MSIVVGVDPAHRSASALHLAGMLARSSARLFRPRRADGASYTTYSAAMEPPSTAAAWSSVLSAASRV